MKTEEWIEELVQTADNGQRYVLRDDITELLIDETALLKKFVRTAIRESTYGMHKGL